MKKQWFEIWILGGDENGHATDYEKFFGEFADRKSAAQAFQEY